MISCRYCGQETPAVSVYCMICGQRLARKKRGEARRYPKARKLADGSLLGQLMVGGVRLTVKAASESEYRARIDALRSGVVEAKKAPPSVTLGAALDRYIETRRPVLSPSTVTGYLNVRKKRFADYMGQDVASIDWQAMVSTEAGGSISAKTLKNAWSVCKAAAKAAGATVPKVQLPQIIRAERPFLQPEQVPTFIAALAGRKCRLAALLALHGLRQSEIQALDWAGIDIKAGTIRVAGAVVYDEDHKPVRREENKNPSSRRTVPVLLPELSEALQAARPESGTGPVVSISPSSLYKGINAACEAAGLPKTGVHGLRHSFASVCWAAGVEEKVCMEWGGWSDRETLSRIYTHVSDAARAEAADKFRAAVGA